MDRRVGLCLTCDVAASVTKGDAAMGLYADWVLPRFLDVMMGLEQTSAERQKCLSDVQGTVLEVGFGSGRNLPWYPTGVRKVIAVDPSTASAKLARERTIEFLKKHVG